MGKKDKKHKKESSAKNAKDVSADEVSVEEKEQPDTESSEDQITDVEYELQSPEQKIETLLGQIERLQAEKEEFRDKNLRLLAEFENFRRRSARERMDLVQTASQDLMRDLLPVVDDFDRATLNVEKTGDVKSIVEGYTLIAAKLENTLSQKGLKAMQAKGTDFDPELHEAITEIPAPSKDLKGKVVDVIEKGYLLNDKIIRYAKVVVGK